MTETTEDAAITSGAIAGRAIVGIGRVHMWNGGSVWMGRQTGHAKPHAHHAIQISLAMTGSFLIRTNDGSAWARHIGAIVMPHRRHEFDGCGNSVAVIFVEPETAQGRSLLDRYGRADVTGLEPGKAQELAAGLLKAFESRTAKDKLIQLSRQAIACLGGLSPPSSTVDPRIGSAITWMRARLGRPISLNAVADVVHLSPSRFRHLFTDQTGASFRAYLLWARVECAVDTAMGGTPWTMAAQDAGFADSAHLSRTCRRMFGLSPVMLVRE